MPPSRADLDNKAYAVADAHRSGPLAKLAWDEMIAELKARCPGFSDADYSDALNDGFTASR